MLDYRMNTFITLCETMNYRRTAEQLLMTQPAVTQHIHFLEAHYGCTLFQYNHKKLTMTKAAKKLLTFTQSQVYQQQLVQKQLLANPIVHLRIGATKTIGEFSIDDIILSFMAKKDHNLELTVDNTKHLLQALNGGLLDFALIEGAFDQSRYAHRRYKEVPFIGICSTDHPFANQEVNLEQIYREPLILREKGSGTRDIFEQLLRECNNSISIFSRVTSVNNFSMIKTLVKHGLGISFVYQPVADSDPNLATFSIKDRTIVRSFNFVALGKEGLDQIQLLGLHLSQTEQ